MIDKNYLPSDGSIVIIDDNINEVIPFFQILSQRGIAFTYYNGAEKYIPTTPQQKIRLVFLDIQLVYCHRNNFAISK
jgi:FixJ family two-component response regulator